MPPSPAPCPRCGALNDPGIAACATCGQSLASSAPDEGAPAPMPAPQPAVAGQGKPRRGVSRRAFLWTALGVTGGVAASYFVYHKITDPNLLSYTGQYVNTAVWSPDGMRVASTGVYGMHAWEALTGRTLLVCRPKDDLGGVVWSEDGARLVTLLQQFDGPVATARTLIVTAEVWDAATGQRLRSLLLNPPGAPSNPISVALNEPYLAVLRQAPAENNAAGGGQGSQQAVIEIWDVGTGQMLTTIGGFSYFQANGMLWAPDRRRLATVTVEFSASDPSNSSGHVAIWDAPTGQRLSSFTLPLSSPPNPPQAPITWLPDGQSLALGLDVYSIATGARQMSYQADGNRVEAVAWSADGQRLAVATIFRGPGLYTLGTNTIFVLDTADGRQRLRHDAGRGVGDMALAFSPDGRYLLVTTNGAAEVWRTE